MPSTTGRWPSSGKLLASVGWTAVNEAVLQVVFLAGALMAWNGLHARLAIPII
jgi:hypothetical protein